MLGTTEILVVAIVGIMVVDPRKLPDLMKSLGKAIGEFKQMSTDVKQSFEREAEMAEFEKRKAEAHEELYGDKAAAGQAEHVPQPPVERDPDLENRQPEPESETPIEMPDPPADEPAA